MNKQADNLVSNLAQFPDKDGFDADGNQYTSPELMQLRAMNEIYTHVVAGGKNRIVSEKPCPVNGKAFVFENPDEFRQQFTHQRKIGNKRPGAAWFDWPGKNFKQGGIGIYPEPLKCPENVFNLYPGFAIESAHGDCDIFLRHLKEVLCNGCDSSYEYLMGWLAHMIQKPEEKPSVAVVLKSVEGTGKGTLFKPLKTILGPLAVQVNGVEQITGKFNSLVANKLIVFGDEVELTNRRASNRLKGLISEPSATVELKGIDAQQVPNYARFIFAGNGENMILAGTRERRYLVLEPSAHLAQDKDYFDGLHRWAGGTGPQALLYLLSHWDISGFDPRRAPVTYALIEEKLGNLKLIDAYLLEQLMSDSPFQDAKRLETNYLARQFRDWAGAQGEQLSLMQSASPLGKAMKRIGVNIIGRPDRGDGKRWYEFPELNVMRAKFAESLGHESNEIFE